MDPEAERVFAGSFEDDATSLRQHERQEDPERDRALLKVVERLILPRLAVSTPSLHRPDRFGDPLTEEVAGLTDFALLSETTRSRGLLRRLHASGASFRDLQLGLLVPAARRLGWLWDEDAVSFFDVSLATGNLQHMMRFVALDLDPAIPRPDAGRSILIAPMPGEQHSFGAAMAAEFFRKDGWTVQYEPEAGRDGLVELVERLWIDVVGLSIAADRDLDVVRDTIAALRAGARNQNLLVIAGGEALARNPGLIGEIGADAGIAALDVAPRQAHRLVDAIFAGKRRCAG